MNNIDKYNVKRGFCTECNECPEFERNQDSTKNVCGYCGCYPTKHRKLSVDSIHDDSNSDVSQNTSGENENSLQLSEDSSDVVDRSVLQESGSEEIEINETTDLSTLIPEFPTEIQELIDEDKKLLASQISVIIRLVTEKLMEKNLDIPGIILEMSILLTDKYPLQLASEYGEKNSQTHNRLKFCCKYYRSRKKDAKCYSKKGKKKCIKCITEIENDSRRITCDTKIKAVSSEKSGYEGSITEVP
ncbi:uncharacterized protein LOC122504680 [Leptopilina heterotoma]|uniref:uncharacterized protein LOC122504680 n=1 Tax=Leptopilina heterotoma TaxID=63436 RepID=UPI001CA87250|nr:uncharacterized protein LOC122504680 [Leptopilina heterotoma]